MRLEERLKQVEKRIAELTRKADAIRAELKPEVKAEVKAEEVIEAPRRRGRRKLNEAE